MQMRQRILAFAQELHNRRVMLERLLYVVLGVLLACVVHYYLILPSIVNTNAIVANAQGKVDVMQQYCRADLEKAGIIKKGEK